MNNMQTNQTPEALAEDIKRLANQLGATSLDRSTEAELRDAINRLRDMAVSGAKDAEPMVPHSAAQRAVNHASLGTPGSLSEATRMLDAAIAAKKRG